MTPDPKRQNVPDDPSDIPMFGLPSVPGDLDPLERRSTAKPTPPTDDDVIEEAAPEEAVIVEDPRDVARRLVDAARKKAAPPPPDPRDVARQLAEEARKKAAARPNLADLAPKPAPPKAEPPKAVEPKPEPGKRLSDRGMPQSRSAPVDALAAIEAARKAEDDAARRPREAAPRAAAPAAPAAPAPPAAPAAPSTTVNAADVAAKLFPGLTITREIRIGHPAVAKALWTAHRARAAATHDLALVGAASAILDAIERLPAGALVALEVTIAGQNAGLWVDTHRGALLAVSGQPEFTLAGL